MKFSFTDSQNQALAVGDYSLLVAAGAGSGKTRVLIERVVRRLLNAENGRSTDITRFLIVTFTNAAAGELCERIRKALTDAAENAADAAQREAAVKNLALLPQAKICTIDSFCYDFVREHAELLQLPSKLRIADATEMDVLLDELIDTLIEERMALCAQNRKEGKPDYFLTVYDMFSAPRNDNAFVETLKNLYDKLLHRPSPNEFLERSCALYREVLHNEEFFDTTYGKALKDKCQFFLSQAISTLEAALDACEDDEQMHKSLSPVFENDLETLRNLSSGTSAGYSNAVDAFSFMEFKRSPSVKKIENPEAPLVVAKRKKAIDAVKGMQKDYFSVPSALLKKCAEDCLHVAEVLKDLLATLDERLWEVKRSHGILSFSDVERLTLKLLYADEAASVPSRLAHDMSGLFDELYIDEYQDVDPIQDKIFLALSRKTSDGTECGRFLVGDAKQSIYRFRGATPEIFMHYRDTFGDCAGNEPRRKLFMSDNFRCSQSVIDFTNAVFERVFDHYDENEKLTCSRFDKDALGEPVHMILCNTDLLAETGAENRRLAEAEVVYRQITAILNDPAACDSTGRCYDLSDFAVLTSKWDAAKQLERYFSQKGLAVICDKGESFFDRREIRLALSVLAMTDNPWRDIPLAGVLRSPVGGFHDDELVRLRLAAKDKKLYEAVCLAAEQNAQADSEETAANGDFSHDETLTEKCRRFLALLDKLRALSRGCGASEFLRKMYALTDLPAICAAGDRALFGKLSPEARKKNLMLLYDKARAFDSTVFRGISAFLDYMNDIKNGEGLKSCTDTVGGLHIMTIHHSKGLEFPICFLFDAGRRPSAREDNCLLSDDYGLAFRLKGYADIRSVAGNDGFVSAETPFRRLISEQADEGEAKEYRRLLYVALTRARDRLYITASPKPCKPKNGDPATSLAPAIDALADPDGAAHGKTFLDLMFGFAATQKPFAAVVSGNSEPVPFADKNGRVFLDICTVRCADEGEQQNLPTAEEALPEAGSTRVYEPDQALLEKIRTSVAARKHRLNEICAVPPKLTVSLLKEGLIDYENAALASVGERALRETPDFVRETESRSAAERGTAMHVFMQFADFAACEAHGAKKEAERLTADGFLTQAQLELLDLEKLDGFFQTALYQRIRAAQNVYRELRFNLKVPAERVLTGAPATDDFVLVQGVIDCFVEEADGSFTVIDFKTDRVKKGGEQLLVDRYANQLAFYCLAVADMTKAPVKQAVIFSFSLMKEIVLDPEKLKFGEK